MSFGHIPEISDHLKRGETVCFSVFNFSHSAILVQYNGKRINDTKY